MLSIEKLRETSPELKDMPDDELIKIRGLLYSAAELALESYFTDKEPKV